jgi:hypothetical protein
MKHEKKKLLAMLNENKITKDDYQLLLNAIEGKSQQSLYSWFINPFAKIAGFRALVIGIIIIIALSVSGEFAQVYYSGIFDCLNASNLKHMQVHMPTFTLLLQQNLVNWLVLSTVFMTIARLFRQKRLRVLDFFGTVAMSRFPYLVLSTFILIIWKIDPTLLDFDPVKINIKQFHFSIPYMIIDFAWQFCYAWQVTTYIFAFKESSGLRGTRLWIGFVVSIFIADALAHAIDLELLYKI